MAFYKKRRRAGAGPPAEPPEPSGFTAERLKVIAHDVKSGVRPTPKSQPWISIGDDRQPGLRAIIRKSGAVTFHCMYYFGASRPMVLVGQFPETSIEEARHLAQVVRGLAEKGIDVQEGLHERLLRELQEEGLNWRPNRKVDATTLVDRMLHVLRQEGINVSAKIKSRVLSELRSVQ